MSHHREDLILKHDLEQGVVWSSIKLRFKECRPEEERRYEVYGTLRYVCTYKYSYGAKNDLMAGLLF
jgi:hypothetical protein